MAENIGDCRLAYRGGMTRTPCSTTATRMEPSSDWFIANHGEAGDGPFDCRSLRKPSGSAGSPKIPDERAGWAEKPGVHMILGGIKPSGKRGDDPSKAATFGLCSTKHLSVLMVYSGLNALNRTKRYRNDSRPSSDPTQLGYVIEDFPAHVRSRFHAPRRSTQLSTSDKR